MNESIFRAYDVRGIYPLDLSEADVLAIASFLNEKMLAKGKIVLAHDARKSSLSLYQAAIKAFKGREIIKVGPATTTMFYALVVKYGAAGGVMITASHNPKEWNGMKAVSKKAVPISGKDILAAMNKGKKQ